MTQLMRPGSSVFYEKIKKIENKYNYVNIYLRDGTIIKINKNDPSNVAEFTLSQYYDTPFMR